MTAGVVELADGPRTIRAGAMLEELMAVYRNGPPVAPGTGFRNLDRHYRPALGQWTVVTGYPGSGKSEFVDALVMNLVKRDDWRVIFYSPENFPHWAHVSKLAEKLLGKPFDRGPSERMTAEELEDAVAWLDKRIGFIRQTQEQRNDIGGILMECWAWCSRYENHPRGIVIDPWNELEHMRPTGKSETEYVSEALATLRRFARQKGCHVWLIAHPAKLQRDRDGKRPVPTPADISGSAHFWNKADNALCIHRPSYEDDRVEVHVQKVRSKWCGSPGLVRFRYCRASGQYIESP